MSFENIPDDVQIAIFCHLSFYEIIATISKLSKQHNKITSQDSYIWKLLNIQSIFISARPYHPPYGNNRSLRILFCVDDKFLAEITPEDKNENYWKLASKLKLLSNIKLTEFKLEMGIKPLYYVNQHIEAMKLMHEIIFENLGNIKHCETLNYHSYPSGKYSRINEKKYDEHRQGDFLQTKLYSQILKSFEPKILIFSLAVMPKIIDDEGIDCVQSLYIHRNIYYELSHMRGVLSKLRGLKTISLSYIFDEYDHHVTCETIKSIKWPKGLEYFARCGNTISPDKLNALKQSVTQQCPNLKEFKY